MSDLFKTQLNKYHETIEKVQLKIDGINEITNIATANLEAKKKELRSIQDSNVKLTQENINDIHLWHNKNIGKLATTFSLDLKKTSVEQFDHIIDELDKGISRIQADRDVAVIKLERKKREIQDHLQSIEKIDILLRAIILQISECTLANKKEMRVLKQQRKTLLAATDFIPSERALALAELDWEIAEKQQCHTEYIQSLQRQKDESVLKMKEHDIDINKEVDKET